jgi:hypothetical protein
MQKSELEKENDGILKLPGIDAIDGGSSGGTAELHHDKGCGWISAFP